MSYDLPDHRLAFIGTAPAHRARRLRELGLGQKSEPAFDTFAYDLAQAAQQLTSAKRPPMAMVNFITDRQVFAGLYPGAPANSALATGPGAVEPGREMDLDQGFCPHVVERQRALPLDNVSDYPRFAGNRVTSEYGIVSYLGAPVFDVTTGIVLGTVCVVDRETREWGNRGLELIKSKAAQITQLISERNQLLR